MGIFELFEFILTWFRKRKEKQEQRTKWDKEKL